MPVLAFRRLDADLANKKKGDLWVSRVPCEGVHTFPSFLLHRIPQCGYFRSRGSRNAPSRETTCLRYGRMGGGKKRKRHVEERKKNTWQSQRDRSGSEFPGEKNLIIVRRGWKRWSGVGEREWKYCVEEKAARSWKRDKRMCRKIRGSSITLMRADGVAELERKWKCNV